MIAPEIYIKRALKASSVQKLETVQSLWSGYGEIARYEIADSEVAEEVLGHLSASTVILKSIRLDKVNSHPRGWQSTLSHERKLHSYEVEANWYTTWSENCRTVARVGQCYDVLRSDNAIYILMEDLDASGFSERKMKLSASDSVAVLNWLASFHAYFLSVDKGSDAYNLWSRGTYWHLATRPDEWNAMQSSDLKEHASAIDNTLEHATYKTLVHGDAKVANFCFSTDLQHVAAVDFQYIGSGVGVQDVAYFLGSCLSEEELASHLPFLLETYFSELSRCLVARGESPDYAERVVEEWDALFPVAWADFHRFILGWCPEHAKITPFSRAMATKGVDYVLTQK